MQIAGRSIGNGSSPLVVAEIGNNHDGSLKQALRLVELAAEAGADAVKVQTHIAAAELLESTPTPPHFDEPRYAFTQRMELSSGDHAALKEHAERRGLIFFSSPFSVEAVQQLEEVGIPAYKIASGELTNPPLLEAVAATGKPVLLSTGMSGLEEIDDAVSVLRKANVDFAILQCTSTYPCPPEQVHLRAMPQLAARYGCLVGISDHTPDIYTAIAAVALGAAVVEKHFTLDKQLYGPDHHASLLPDELARLVDGVRTAHTALGSGSKERDPRHDPVRATFEKSVVVREPVAAGTLLERSHLTTKRPGTGIPATRIESVVGRCAARDLAPDRLLEEADFV